MPDWTNPKNWLAGATVTAAQLNTYVSDNTSYLYSPDAAGVYRSTDKTCTSGAWEVVNFDSEAFITRTRLHGNGADNSRLGPGATGSTGYAGRYLFIAHVEFETDTTGNYRRVQIRKNSAGSSGSGTAHGMTTARPLGGGAVAIQVEISKIITMNASDYCEMFVTHDASTNIKAKANNDSTFFQCHYLGN